MGMTEQMSERKANVVTGKLQNVREQFLSITFKETPKEILDDIKVEVYLHKQMESFGGKYLLKTREVSETLGKELCLWGIRRKRSVKLEAFLCVLKAASVQNQDGQEEKWFMNLLRSSANAISGWSREYGGLHFQENEIEERHDVVEELLAAWTPNVKYVARELEFDWSSEDDLMVNKDVYNCIQVLEQLRSYHKELKSFQTFVDIFPEFFSQLEDQETTDCVQRLNSALHPAEKMEWENSVEKQRRAKEFLEESTVLILENFLTSEKCHSRVQYVINAMRDLDSWVTVHRLRNNAQKSVLCKLGADLCDIQHQLQITDTFSEKGSKLRSGLMTKVFQRRLLYQQLKRSYNVVTNTGKASDNAKYIALNQQHYIAVAKYIRSMENAFYTSWCKCISSEVKSLLCVSTLIPNVGLALSSSEPPDFPTYFNSSHESRIFLGMHLYIPKPCSILVQEESILFQRWRNLQTIYQDLRHTSQLLSDVENGIVEKDWMILQKKFGVLCRRATWSTLAFSETASQFAQELTAFKALVYNVQNISSALEEKLTEIEPLQLITEEIPQNNQQLLLLEDFVKQMKSQADAFYGKLSNILDSLIPPLMQLESLIVSQSTGSCRQLCEFYLLWEGKIYNVLLRHTTDGMKGLYQLLNRSMPTFELKTQLVVPYVTTNPSLPDLYAQFNSAVRYWIRKSQSLKRWKRYSCTTFPESYTYTYFDDLICEPIIKVLSQDIQSVIKQTLLQVKADLKKWRIFVKLWRREKELDHILIQQSRGDVPITVLDNGLEYYEHLKELFKNLCQPSTIGFFRLNNVDLSSAVLEHAHNWTKKFADTWLEIVSKMTENFDCKMDPNAGGVQVAESNFNYIAAVIQKLELYGLNVPWLVKDKNTKLQLILLRENSSS